MRYEQDFVWSGEYRTLLTGQSINSIFWRARFSGGCWRFLSVSGGFCGLLAVSGGFLAISGGFLAVFSGFSGRIAGCSVFFWRFLSVSGGFLSVFSRFSLWFLWFFFGRVSFLYG